MTLHPASLPSPSPVVCHCFRISEREILAAIHNGASSVPEVFAATNASGGCRGCIFSIERMLQGLPPTAFRCTTCGDSPFLCQCESGFRMGLPTPP
jgi:NAD(P)H-nitrite reductase large subunit